MRILDMNDPADKAAINAAFESDPAFSGLRMIINREKLRRAIPCTLR